MRRCSLSVPSNIAEGYRRGHRKEFVQLLQIAYGSASELETQLLFARDVGYLKEICYKEENDLLVEVLKMLNSMLHKLKS